MNSFTTRAFKEARPLFWPWCAVAFAGLVLPVFLPDLAGRLALLLGVPLLAGIAVGIEFEHRTLSLLLSQPIGRMRIWLEKLAVTLIATLSALLVLSLSWVGPHEPEGYDILFLTMMISSAMFCTLAARSAVGGYALNVILFITIQSVGGMFHIRLTTGAAVMYSGLMLLFGYWALVRFQATEGVAATDLIMSNRAVTQPGTTGLLRCRPGDAALNIVRKELRLLRPLWLIVSLFVLGWIAMGITVWFVPQVANGQSAALLANILTLTLATIYVPLVAILAGSLPLAEEKASGMHNLNLTLPVAAWQQWLVKLAVALSAAGVCIMVVPFLVVVGAWLTFGAAFGSIARAWTWLTPDTALIAVLLSFGAFWCACARKGVLSAALWSFAFAAILFGAVSIGVLLSTSLAPVATLHRTPIALTQETIVFAPFILTMLLAISQSYRMFRTPPGDGILPTLRFLLPLAATAFASGAVLKALALW